MLHDRGLIKKAKHDVVVLGNGEVSKALEDFGASLYQERARKDRKGRRRRDGDR